jgi:hypothetical protein
MAQPQKPKKRQYLLKKGTSKDKTEQQKVKESGRY